MDSFNSSRKIFFLYPPREFVTSAVTGLFREGFEVYVLNSSEKLLPLLDRFPDAVLFINTDYPSRDFQFHEFCDRDLEGRDELAVYAVFREGVGFAERIKDYISLDREEKEIINQLRDILKSEEAHGKREYVRFGSYDVVLGEISFNCGDRSYRVSMHDISPKALSFSTEEDVSSCMGRRLEDIHLTVGAYKVTVTGVLDSGRTIAGKAIHVVMFEGEKKQEIFNFIYTSLEKSMDELITTL